MAMATKLFMLLALLKIAESVPAPDPDPHNIELLVSQESDSGCGLGGCPEDPKEYAPLQSCPPFFELHGNCCYYFSKKFGNQANRADAETHCKVLKTRYFMGNFIDFTSHLAELGVSGACCDDGKFMEAIGKNSVAGDYTYLGAIKRVSTSTTWTWPITGTGLQLSSSFWGSDQPDGYKGGHFVIEDCVATYLYPDNHNRVWLHDYRCDQNIYYICQAFK